MSTAIRDAARDVLAHLYRGNCLVCHWGHDDGALPHAPGCPVAALERALGEGT